MTRTYEEEEEEEEKEQVKTSVLQSERGIHAYKHRKIRKYENTKIQKAHDLQSRAGFQGFRSRI